MITVAFQLPAWLWGRLCQGNKQRDRAGCLASSSNLHWRTCIQTYACIHPPTYIEDLHIALLKYNYLKTWQRFGDTLVEWRDADIAFFKKVFPVLFLLGPNEENTIVWAVFANSQQGNQALILRMKARCCSHLSVFIAAPDGLIGKALGPRRARKAAG